MHPSPLHDTLAATDATFLPYGPGNEEGSAVELVETFGNYHAEYAAIRKGVGIFDTPHRAAIRLTGADRIDLLHRFLTNQVQTLEPGEATRGFLLNNKGRIMADLVVAHRADDTLLLLDAVDAPAVAEEFENLLFTEDVQIQDQSATHSHLALHGPAALKLITTALPDFADAGKLKHGKLATHDTLVALRWDTCGSPGVELLLPREELAGRYETLTRAVGGIVPDVDADAAGGGAKRPIVGRGIGWLAYNTARIEAGTVLFHVDFGPDCIPQETGSIDHTVSFTKGCYRGQEVVARVQHLGKPKKQLVGLRFEDDQMPIAGSQVFAPEDPDNLEAKSTGAVIGAVTSSTTSPMRSNHAIALAMIKQGYLQAGTKLLVPAEGEMVVATVGALRSLP